MSVYTANEFSDIPKNAEILSRTEAINYEWAMIEKWKPKNEIWALLNGYKVIGGFSALVNMYLNIRIRKRLEIHQHGGIVSAIAIGGGGLILGGAMHLKEIVHNMLLDTKNCFGCMEVKSALVASAATIVHPMIIGSVVNFSIGTIYAAKYIPSIKDVAALYTFWVTMLQPMLPILGVIFVLTTVLSVGITICERRAIERVRYFEYEKLERLQAGEE